MPLWQACAILSLFCVSLLSEASEIKTTYSISSTSTTVTTAIKGAELKHEELMHDYPFEKLVKCPTKLAVVGNRFPAG